MSYGGPYNGGGGGNRRRRREPEHDYHDRRQDFQETPEQKLRNTIIKLGEVDAVEELPRLVAHIRAQQPTVGVPSISEGLRIAVTEQPFKIPYYAALLRLLHDPNPDPTSIEEGPSLGKQILEDFWKGFQAFLDKLAWREARLCVHFFAHLALAGIVAPDSLASLLQSFTAVLDEFGVSYGRARRAALCAAEGLMIAGSVLKDEGESVAEIITAIQSFNDSVSTSKWLVQPSVRLYAEDVPPENADELLDTALSTLNALAATEFAASLTSFPRPYASYAAPDPSQARFALPSVLVPPEIIELDDGEGEGVGAVRREEWPEWWMRLFDAGVTPDPRTAPGYAVRAGLLDIIDIFEVNRKECVRLLMEYPKWALPGSFKAKPGAPAAEEGAEVDPEKGWQLESTIIETILGAFFLLPEPTHKSIYPISLITELCKLSPSTVGPAVGKSIRKLYGALADGLDVDAARRFAEWFAVHMSNFGFQWVWKEWIPDLALVGQHPKRAFMRRALEFEIRLSYHDRILKTLPPAMQEEDANVIPGQAPGPDFDYEEPTSPHHDAAQSILNLLRGRAKPEEVVAHVDSLRTSLESSDPELNIDTVVRSIAVQSLLNIGSRSFSHLLNAIERYLPLLRALAGTTPDAQAKADILTAAAAFWKRNRQMVNIVFDKLMQYQIVDPTDVVAWTFAHVAGGGPASLSDTGPLSLSAFEWDLLKGALDKANGRVMIARRKVAALRKEEDDAHAKAKAKGGVDVSSMEVDGDTKADEDIVPAVDSPALVTALKAFASLTREQKAALSRTLDGFVSCLAPLPSDSHPNPHAAAVITEDAWGNRANWSDDEWNAWETWGWYRQFCRAYSPYLRNYANTLGTVSFAKIESSTDPAAQLLKRTWNIAAGQE
ncbi:hypothetical protein HWV62_27397 [Athelia sp. TMB]|nr:hypothetical protein HWV62_27397 [Athelia sp. TMB]